MAPVSGHASAQSRLFLLLLACCLPHYSQAHPQDNTPHTTADFENARSKAEDGLTSARSVLKKNADLRNRVDNDATTLFSLASNRDVSPSAIKALSDIDLQVKDLLGSDNKKIADRFGGTTKDASDQVTALQALCKALGDLQQSADFKDVSIVSADLHDRVLLTLSNCDSVLKDLGKESDLNDATLKKVLDTFPKIVSQATEVTKTWNDQLAKLADAWLG